MKILSFTTLVATCSLLFCVASAEFKYSGDQVWKVTANNHEKLEVLKEFISQNALEIDAWKPSYALNVPADLHIPQRLIASSQAALESAGLDIQVMISDMRSLLMESVQKNDRERELRSVRAPRAYLDFNYGEYHTVDEVDEWMDMVVAEVDYVTKFQVGVTYEGRPIYAMKIQKDPSVQKPVIYIDALIHCREWITTAATVWMFAQVFSEPDLAYLTDNVDWYFIPMINKDGYVHTWTNQPDNRLWRKTRSKGVNLERNDACQGVDANRNWPSQTWAGIGASGNPCDITYYGPAPASEPEVRHLKNFIEANNDTITAIVSVHSYSQLVLWPFNYDYGVYPPNKDEHNDLAQAMVDAMLEVDGKVYEQGQGAEAIYPCTGVTTDWTPEVGIPLSYTFELRDTGEYGFVLPPDQIIPNGQEMLVAMDKLYEQVLARGSTSK